MHVAWDATICFSLACIRYEAHLAGSPSCGIVATAASFGCGRYHTGRKCKVRFGIHVCVRTVLTYSDMGRSLHIRTWDGTEVVCALQLLLVVPSIYLV